MKKHLSLILIASLMLITNACNEATNTSSSSAVDMSKTYSWRMVTTWPPNFPVLGEAAQMLADDIEKMSNGRLKIKVYGGGELVPPLEAFDAVSEGTADIGSGASYYWVGKTPAAQYFAAIPFGMNAQQMQSWLTSGGGYELWKEVYEPFGLVPFMGGHTGVQMGGWFNKEINTIEDMQGLKMRIPGIAGKVIEKAGGAAAVVAGSEVYTNLERGVIDAAEWIGPYHDHRMGFHKITKYYYTPGWHEPTAHLEYFVNKEALEALPEDLQSIVEMATYRSQAWMLAEFDQKNAIFMEKLLNEHDVQMREFPQPVLDELKKYTKESLQELIADDPMAQKVHQHYFEYLESSSRWLENTEVQYYGKIR